MPLRTVAPKRKIEGAESLSRLSSLDPEEIRLNLGTNEANDRFRRQLKLAIAMAKALEDGRVPPNMPFFEDVEEFLAYLPTGRGYTEVRDGGARAFDLLDRAINSMNGVLAATGRFVVKTGEDYRVDSAVTPQSLELERRTEEIAKRLGELEGVISQEMVADAKRAENEIKETRATIKRLLSEASKDVTTIKVGDYHKFFAETAGRHKRRAFYWLISTSLLALVTLFATIGFAWLAYFPPDGFANNFSATAAKTSIIVVLLSATIWAGLNFRSHQHNAVVNQHRSDALGTFDAFWNAANTPDAKDSVLVQTSGSIHLPQNTAFAGKSGATDPGVIGLIATMSGRKE